MSKGPQASPSSHTVTSRILADLLCRPSRSRMIRSATGTIPMHVKVLDLVSVFGAWANLDSTHTVKDSKASKKTTPILYPFGHSMGLSGSPLGSKSTSVLAVGNWGESIGPSKG
jgi:hypothetical protein